MIIKGHFGTSNFIPYSETCVNDHSYSETTCIKRPFRDVLQVSAQYLLTCIRRPPLYKGHYEVVHLIQVSLYMIDQLR